MWTIYTDFAKSNKPGELNDEGMVLNLIGILEPLKAIILLLHFTGMVNYQMKRIIKLK